MCLHRELVEGWFCLHSELIDGWLCRHMELAEGWLCLHRELVEGWLCLHRELVEGWFCLHRDLKPSNIFVKDDDMLCLGDFGVSTVMGDLRTCPRNTVGELLTAVQWVSY